MFYLRTVRPSIMYQLVTLTSFDHELTSVYDLEVTCRDQGSPVLTTSTHVLIFVRDLNDNSPRLEQVGDVFVEGRWLIVIYIIPSGFINKCSKMSVQTLIILE